MSDLEMTKLCAQAMGFGDGLGEARDPETGAVFWVLKSFGYPKYDPLHDDAQAMALVKRFHINLDKVTDGWLARQSDAEYGTACVAHDLNRAIVECVAKLHQARKEL